MTLFIVLIPGYSPATASCYLASCPLAMRVLPSACRLTSLGLCVGMYTLPAVAYIMSNQIWHRGAPNVSDRPRILGGVPRSAGRTVIVHCHFLSGFPIIINENERENESTTSSRCDLL